MQYEEFKAYISSGEVAKAREEFLKLYNNRITQKNLIRNNLLKQAVKLNDLIVVKFLLDECGVGINWNVDSYGNKALFFVNDVVTAQLLISCGANVNGKGVLNRSPIHEAADASIAQLYLSKGSSIHAVDIKGNTPLHIAAQNGKMNVVKFLLEQNADVNLRDNNGKNLLYKSAINNNLLNVKFFQKQGLSFDSSDILPLLQNAVRNNNTEMIKLLLGYASRNEIRNAEFTNISNLETVKLLVSYNADLQKCSNLLNQALSVNVYDRAKLVKYYLGQGLNFTSDNLKNILQNQIIPGNEELIKLLLAKQANINDVPVLHKTSDINLVKWLIAQNADVNKLNTQGKNVLYSAIYQNNCSVDLIKFFLSKGIGFVEQDKSILLERAASNNKKDMVKFLISYGADIKNACVLHNTQDVNMIKWLLDKGADINLADSSSKTALYRAAWSGQYQKVQFLIHKGSTLSAEDNLEVIARNITNNHNVRIIKLLIEHGGAKISDPTLITKAKNLNMLSFLVAEGLDINTSDEQGNTVLHYAVKANNYQLVSFLVEEMKLESLLSKNKDGKTALHYANEYNNKTIASELLSGFNLGMGYKVDEHFDHDVEVLLAGDMA